MSKAKLSKQNKANKTKSSAGSSGGDKSLDSKKAEKKGGKGLLLLVGLAIVAVIVVLAVKGQTPTETERSGETSQTSQPSSSLVPSPESSEEQIAMVNNRPVLKKNFEEMLSMSQSQNLMNSEDDQPPEPSMDMKLEVLDSLISLNLAIQQAYELGYGPSEAEIEDGVNQIMGNYPNTEDIEKALASFGTDMKTVRSQVADSIAVRSWRDTAFIKDAVATDEEAVAFYDSHLEEAKHPEQVRAVQIMLPVPLNNGQEDNQAKERVKATAEAIYKEAVEGANFEELMERYMDQMTRAATSNGQMGWINRGGSGFEALDDVLFSLEPGDIGGPVESQFSYHIVKVLEKRPAGMMTYEELKPDILEYLMSVKTDQLFMKTIAEYRRQADIVIFDEALAAAWPAYEEKTLAQSNSAEQGADQPPAVSSSPTE
ncbi:MAG: peptidylprolyl isomerase [Deltaproteobacteria bacterium]|nr:peptidylprolyl isomerase [Deltaproteobacteria bacterium]